MTAKSAAHRGWRIEDRGWRIATFYLLSSIFLLAGCSNLVPAEGKVTFDGQPLESATIIFHPEAKTELTQKGGPRQVSAVTDREGNFKLKTLNRQGVLPGKYKVTVSRRVLPAGAAPPRSNSLAEAMRVNSQSVELVPEIYTRPDQTPLKVEVPRGGNKKLEISVPGQ